MTVPVFKIVPTIQEYDWGRVGRKSKVAQFAGSSGVPEFTIDDDKPYAEVGPSCSVSLIICAFHLIICVVVDGNAFKVSLKSSIN